MGGELNGTDGRRGARHGAGCARAGPAPRHPRAHLPGRVRAGLPRGSRRQGLGDPPARRRGRPARLLHPARARRAVRRRDGPVHLFGRYRDRARALGRPGVAAGLDRVRRTDRGGRAGHAAVLVADDQGRADLPLPGGLRPQLPPGLARADAPSDRGAADPHRRGRLRRAVRPRGRDRPARGRGRAARCVASTRPPRRSCGARTSPSSRRPTPATARGDELVCLCELSSANLRPRARARFEAGLIEGPPDAIIERRT